MGIIMQIFAIFLALTAPFSVVAGAFPSLQDRHPIFMTMSRYKLHVLHEKPLDLPVRRLGHWNGQRNTLPISPN